MAQLQGAEQNDQVPEEPVQPVFLVSAPAGSHAKACRVQGLELGVNSGAEHSQMLPIDT